MEFNNNLSFENRLNTLQQKYYYNKPDCVWNQNCDIPPNNWWYFYINKPTNYDEKVNKMICQKKTTQSNILYNCDSDLNSKLFLNRSCPCILDGVKRCPCINQSGLNPTDVMNVAIEGFQPYINQSGLKSTDVKNVAIDGFQPCMCPYSDTCPFRKFNRRMNRYECPRMRYFNDCPNISNIRENFKDMSDSKQKICGVIKNTDEYQTNYKIQEEFKSKDTNPDFYDNYNINRTYIPINNYCAEGYRPHSNGKECVKICRNCKVGVCNNGICS